MGNNKKDIELSYQKVRKYAFLYLLIPIIIFLLFFVRLFIALPACIALCGSYIFSIRFMEKKEEKTEFKIKIPLLHFIFIGAICIVWNYLGGQGGFFFQTTDWNERNAILRDLVTYKWPVYYEGTDTMLTYYIGHWMPAALVGKILFQITNNQNLSFVTGNIVLWIWTSVGCFLSMLLFVHYVKPKSRKFLIIVIAIFIFFSGMDILGFACQRLTVADIYGRMHLEWWMPPWQFSSNTTCLFWVYNQAIPAWIATLCFLHEKNCKNYVFIFACTFMCSPLPCIGLFLLMICAAGVKLLQAMKEKKTTAFVKETFSLSNIVVTLMVLPVIAAYYITNLALDQSSGRNTITFPSGKVILVLGSLCLLTLIGLLVNRVKNDNSPKVKCTLTGLLFIWVSFMIAFCIQPQDKWQYILFLFLEVGLYLICLIVDYYDNPMYYILSCLLIIIPTIKLGTDNDFCMRASIPMLIILVCFITESIFREEKREGRRNAFFYTKKMSRCLLIISLCVGIITPGIEIYRGIKNVSEQGSMCLTQDNIVTLDRYKDNGEIYWNFVSSTYKDSVFFKYIMRRSNPAVEKNR